MTSRTLEFLTFPLPSSSSALIRTSALPNSFSLLITDTLESPASFLLLHYLIKSLRREDLSSKGKGRELNGSMVMDEAIKEKRGRTVMVGVSKEEGFYSQVAKKSGVQLATETTKNNYRFISAASCITSPGPESLQLLWDNIIDAVGLGGEALVIIDDVSALAWSGIETKVLLRWIRSLRSHLLLERSSLILLMHGDELSDRDSEDSYVFRRLLQTSDLWLETTSLSSQSRGELSIHRGPSLLPREYHDDIINRSGATALHYKLEEAGAVFSIKGLGQGFL